MLFKVESSSMYPTVCSGSLVVARPLHSGDQEALVKNGVYIALRNGRPVVKRVVAGPGDAVEHRHDSYRVVPGGTDAARGRDDPRIEVSPLRAGEYFLLGDNLLSSEDSRHYGSLKREHILARAVAAVRVRWWGTEAPCMLWRTL